MELVSEGGILSECFTECAADCTLAELSEWMESEGLVDETGVRSRGYGGRRRSPAPESNNCDSCMSESCAAAIEEQAEAELSADLALATSNAELVAECASECTMPEAAEWLEAECQADESTASEESETEETDESTASEESET